MNQRASIQGEGCAFSVAGMQDVASIVDLVNRAYRPTPGEAGWTHEAHLVSGARTDAAQVEALIAASGSVVLVGRDHARVVACVHVEAGEGGAHLGMLAVDPVSQGQGLGTRLLEFAEDHAREAHRANRFLISVVSRRAEFVHFYLRRGYRETGRVLGFPDYAGVPKEQDLELVELEKPAIHCA